MTARIEWARAKRGRVWHLIDQSLDTYCGDDGRTMVEHLYDSPPRGGRVCPRCVERVAEVQRAVNAALAQQAFTTGEPAAPNEYGTDSLLDEDMSVSDKNLDQATNTVALRVAADLAEDCGDEWGNYPEIGESDWLAVQDRVAFIAGELKPEEGAYLEAYGLLERRADGVEA